MADPISAAPGAAETPIVALAGVGKTYSSGLVALANVSIAVRAREFVTLLGPSGCGKSTILRLVAGLGTLSAGRIDWPSEAGDPAGLAARRKRRNIGFVFQEPTLMPWATVRDNVYLPLRLAREPREAARARVDEAIAQVGLDGFEDSYPRELSGGMKMRVSIARALVTGPELLLMDEPFAALDEITRFRLNNDLLRLWQRRRLTVVFVTHSVYESVYLSERILVMSGRPGRVVEEIKVPTPYPRDEVWRNSADYGALCAATSAALARASAGTGQAERATRAAS
ncbi:MAG TPA: ABC transporter ATP-binding protein [Alphaproteobacteria bacterium]|nr:ABC transporter ATP-binding protein [Alphaproteobacteria bacterium]